MIELTLAEIAEITGGELAGGADPGATVWGSVEFDSRLVQPGGLFLALPGERVDGADFAAGAIAAGATAVLATRALEHPSIVVADGLAALSALAATVIRRLPDVRVIGITGSSGKTSTKDLLAQLLERLGPTVAPPESFNNELGHPYTVLRATRDTRFLILETSARGIGHIKHLTDIAPPHVGVVLNVGSAHLGEFGSREAIAQAKGELIEALPIDGLAVLNADDPIVAAMAGRTVAPVVRFGTSSPADVRALDIEIDHLGRARFELCWPEGSASVSLGLSGEHQVGNALAAAAVARHCGMALDDVAGALAAARPRSRWRMELTERPDGVLVVNDAYNANPESMRAALKTLAGLAGPARTRRTWAVLGEMAELGPTAAAEHDAIGRLAVRLDVSRLVAVGEAARPIAHGGALEGSWNGESTWVPDTDAALELVSRELAPGDVVLVKASRSAGLERVALALAADVAGGTAE
jgi:UDP-N-acetylmuramoyl-tripeptide--D-alanyl-D-alanine ligase